MIGRPMMRRTGRPSLLGAAARTAVVAGTATAVSGSVARRQAEEQEEPAGAAAHEAQQVDEAAVPPPPPPPSVAPTAARADQGNVIEQLRELGELRDSGVLTEEEFAAQKARLLNQ